MMLTTQSTRPARFALLFLLVMASLGMAPADASTALRERTLALNNMTGDDPIKGQVIALIDDATNSRKLILAAVAMTKEKTQPFNYNACLILAESSRGLKDAESSKTFYRLCIDLADAVKSGAKLGQAY